MAASRRFFRLPPDVKAGYVSDLTFSGYIESGEEVTAGEADYSEIFTVCRDVAADDPRVLQRWPCHGPVPWPDLGYPFRMQSFLDILGSVGVRPAAGRRSRANNATATGWSRRVRPARTKTRTVCPFRTKIRQGVFVKA